jgi:pyridoxine 5-phosphate synthase
LPQVFELNIGHYMIGEAIFESLPVVVEKMKTAIAHGYRKRT